MIFVVSGPSGSGKTTLIKKVLQKRAFGDNLTRPVSFTTRQARCGEKHGRDYFFVSKKEFFKKRKNKEFLETTRYLDTYYATSKKIIDGILKRGKDVILCLDTRGSRSVKKLFPNKSVHIFILPPSRKALRQRLHTRASEKYEQIKERLGVAKEELRWARNYDYRILNHSLKEAAENLRKIILKERLRRSR